MDIDTTAASPAPPDPEPEDESVAGARFGAGLWAAFEGGAKDYSEEEVAAVRAHGPGALAAVARHGAGALSRHGGGAFRGGPEEDSVTATLAAANSRFGGDLTAAVRRHGPALLDVVASHGVAGARTFDEVVAPADSAAAYVGSGASLNEGRAWARDMSSYASRYGGPVGGVVGAVGSVVNAAQDEEDYKVHDEFEKRYDAATDAQAEDKYYSYHVRPGQKRAWDRANATARPDGGFSAGTLSPAALAALGPSERARYAAAHPGTNAAYDAAHAGDASQAAGTAAAYSAGVARSKAAAAAAAADARAHPERAQEAAYKKAAGAEAAERARYRTGAVNDTYNRFRDAPTTGSGPYAGGGAGCGGGSVCAGNHVCPLHGGSFGSVAGHLIGHHREIHRAIDSGANLGSLAWRAARLGRGGYDDDSDDDAGDDGLVGGASLRDWASRAHNELANPDSIFRRKYAKPAAAVAGAVAGVAGAVALHRGMAARTAPGAPPLKDFDPGNRLYQQPARGGLFPTDDPDVMYAHARQFAHAESKPPPKAATRTERWYKLHPNLDVGVGVGRHGAGPADWWAAAKNEVLNPRSDFRRKYAKPAAAVAGAVAGVAGAVALHGHVKQRREEDAAWAKEDNDLRLYHEVQDHITRFNTEREDAWDRDHAGTRDLPAGDAAWLHRDDGPLPADSHDAAAPPAPGPSSAYDYSAGPDFDNDPYGAMEATPGWVRDNEYDGYGRHGGAGPADWWARAKNEVTNPDSVFRRRYAKPAAAVAGIAVTAAAAAAAKAHLDARAVGARRDAIHGKDWDDSGGRYEEDAEAEHAGHAYSRYNPGYSAAEGDEEFDIGSGHRSGGAPWGDDGDAALEAARRARNRAWAERAFSEAGGGHLSGGRTWDAAAAAVQPGAAGWGDMRVREPVMHDMRHRFHSALLERGAGAAAGGGRETDVHDMRFRGTSAVNMDALRAALAKARASHESGAGDSAGGGHDLDAIRAAKRAYRPPEAPTTARGAAGGGAASSTATAGGKAPRRKHVRMPWRTIAPAMHARNELVASVAKKRGISLMDASKAVKAEGLYTAAPKKRGGARGNAPPLPPPAPARPAGPPLEPIDAE